MVTAGGTQSSDRMVRHMRPLNLLLLTWLLVLPAACSVPEHLTAADRKYLFFVSEIEHFPIEQYQHRMTPQQVPYIFFKSSSGKGFKGLYGTILVNSDGREVRYLCLVNILPTAEGARALFERMIPEPSPTDFGAEEDVDPGAYHAESAYLYRDDTYFHLILRSARIVYTIMIEGATVQEDQVRRELRRKLGYLEQNIDSVH